MLGNRSRDTKPELSVRRILHADGFRYRVAARPIPTLRRTADILFTRAKVAVFIDGCFWHGCPEHYVEPKSHVDYWRPKIERNVSRDLETTAQLEQAGWIVLRYWSHELSSTVAESVAERVRAARTGPSRASGAGARSGTCTGSGTGTKSGASRHPDPNPVPRAGHGDVEFSTVEFAALRLGLIR
jgi:DNA mismatch endonuclease (patch repair protein)